MTDRAARVLELRVEVASDDELSALRGVLLAARATELGELQRQASRLSHGYGSESTREGMHADVGRLELRKAMLDRLIAGVEAATRDGHRG